jgi:hypothetical protein
MLLFTRLLYVVTVCEGTRELPVYMCSCYMLQCVQLCNVPGVEVEVHMYVMLVHQQSIYI